MKVVYKITKLGLSRNEIYDGRLMSCNDKSNNYYCLSQPASERFLKLNTNRRFYNQCFPQAIHNHEFFKNIKWKGQLNFKKLKRKMCHSIFNIQWEFSRLTKNYVDRHSPLFIITDQTKFAENILLDIENNIKKNKYTTYGIQQDIEIVKYVIKKTYGIKTDV